MVPHPITLGDEIIFPVLLLLFGGLDGFVLACLFVCQSQRKESLGRVRAVHLS